MKRVSLTKKLATAIVAGATAFTLAACSGTSDENNDSATSVSKDSGNGSGSQVNNDGSEEVSEDAQEAAQAAKAFYEEVFTSPVNDTSTDYLLNAQNEMVEAAGSEEIFNSTDPVEAINGLPEDSQKNLVEVTEKYSNAQDFVNYNDVDNANKVLVNIVTMIFQNGVAGVLGDVGLEIIVNENEITVDGDTATLSKNGIQTKSGDQVSEPGDLNIETPLVKTKDGWKVDAEKLVDIMLSPVPQTQESAE